MPEVSRVTRSSSARRTANRRRVHRSAKILLAVTQRDAEQTLGATIGALIPIDASLVFPSRQNLRRGDASRNGALQTPPRVSPARLTNHGNRGRRTPPT